MAQEITIIPRSLRTYSATWANQPTTDLMTGDFYYATDRKVLYRWNGASWDAQSIYSGSGLLADRPDAANLPAGSIYFATDTGENFQVAAGAWILTVQSSAKFSTTQIFNGTSPSTWTDLDLSSVIGAKSSLVMLRVVIPSTAGAAFRRKGDTIDYTPGTASSHHGMNQPWVQLSNYGFVVWVATNSAGVIEWKVSSAIGSSLVYVEAYVN